MNNKQNKVMPKPELMPKKPLAEGVPLHARHSAKISFLILWDCTSFLLKGDSAEKERALKKLESLKQNYENIKSEPFCTHTPEGRDIRNYFSSPFDNHQLGKFYQDIKNAYYSEDLIKLRKISSELETITTGFNSVYYPA